MTTTTEEAAYNDVRATFLSGWNDRSAVIVGSAVTVLYKGLVAAKPSAEQCWVRISTQNVVTKQAALSNGTRRDVTHALVLVQVFVPLTKPDGDLLVRRLATSAKKSFLRRSLSGTIWFRRARVVDLDPDETYHKRNVVAEYQYDELV